MKKQDYKEFDALYLSSDRRVTKFTGHLFDTVLMDLKVSPDKILHIGDNWEHDIVMAKKKGIKTFFLIKAKDQFNSHKNFFNIGCDIGGMLTNKDKMYSSISYRSMLALSTNKIFDNPFRPWVVDSDFNADPYIIGYATVGMHLIGISKWLSNIAKQRNLEHIVFLARDGYLPMKAFQMTSKYFDTLGIKTNYVACSRKVLMPWIVENEKGLYHLPVQFSSHNPLSISQMLNCSYEFRNLEELKHLLNENGFIAEKNFSSEHEYFVFLKWFEKYLFSKDILEKNKAIVSEYYKNCLPKNSCVFDLGYSGRIPVALKKCLGHDVIFAYIHQESKLFNEYKRKYELDIETMYNFIPVYSDLIREFFLSEQGHACLGLEQIDGNITPIFDNEKVKIEEKFVFAQIVSGATDFINDFCDYFYVFRAMMPINEIQISMPFEGMLHCSSNWDREVVSCCNSDDSIYGNRNKIKMSDFWNNQCVFNTCNMGKDISYENMIHAICYNRNLVVKTLIYAICDRKTLKEKVKEKLKNYPHFLLLIKQMYKLFKILVKRKG